jgi:activating signal cointegrator 1
MKAITIWQPYASLLILGLKQYETRSWETNYRGPLIIHAAKRWDDTREMDCDRVTTLMHIHDIDPQTFTDEQKKHFFSPLANTLGKAIGVVDLIDCQPMTDGGSGFENAVGDFGPGRFGWKSANPRIFDPPVSAAGKQGLWVPDAELTRRAKQNSHLAPPR